MGVTSPSTGQHAVINGSNMNRSIVPRLDQSIGGEARTVTERNPCQCCPYGYHIDVDFVRFCEALSGGEGWGDKGKRLRKSRRCQRQSMEGLLGLTGPSVWLMEHHLPKIPQDCPTLVKPDPACASVMVRDALQQAVLDFEDTLKRSSSKEQSDSIPCKDVELEGDSHVTHTTLGSTAVAPSDVPVAHPTSPRTRDTDPLALAASENSMSTSIATLSTATDSLRVSASVTSTKDLIHESCTKVLNTCISEFNQQGQNSSDQTVCVPQHDSDGGSVGSNASGGLSTEALQNIREQMAMSLEKMKEMEEKLKLIPILQVQLSILKEEKRKMLLQLKQKQSGITYHEVRSIANDSTQTTQADSVREKRDAGICCSVLTRDVGTCHQQPRLRDASTCTIIPPESNKTSHKSLVVSPIRTESIQSEVLKTSVDALAMTDLCGKSWKFDREFPKETEEDHKNDGNVARQSKEAPKNGVVESSTTEIGTSSFLKALESTRTKPLMIIEKRDCASQTITDESKSDNLAKKEPIKRDAHVQASLQQLFSISREAQTVKTKLSNVQTQTQGKVTRDMGILAKPMVREAILVAKPNCRDFSSSCNLSEKDTMSVSLQALGVRSMTESTGSISTSKSTDTVDLVLSSDAAVNVCLSEPILSQELPEKCVDTLTGGGSANEISVVEEYSSPSRNDDHILESHEAERQGEKPPYLRQNTYTECKVDVNSISSVQTVTVQSSETEELFSSNEEGLSSKNLTDASKYILEIGRPSQTSENEIYGESSYESMIMGSESTQQYMTEKSHYRFNSSSSNRVKASPSKEMKAAIKVVNDLLQKQTRMNIKNQLKSATSVIQQEWFTVSSTAMANPLDVEDYLDYFDDISVALLEYIVNLPDNTGNTAMHYAVSHGNFDVVSILLDSKVCDIRRTNQAGYTCVMLVSLAEVRSETDRQVVRRLFQMADVNMRAKQHGQTALMLSVSHGRLDMVQLLLEAGADVNIQDEDGSTALMCAAEHGHADIVRALLAQPDCDASIEDNDGSTALNIAMEAGHRNIGVLLYAHEHFQPTSPHGSLKQWRITKHSQSSVLSPAETSS